MSVCLHAQNCLLCLHGAVGEQELWTAEGEGKFISVMLG